MKNRMVCLLFVVSLFVFAVASAEALTFEDIRFWVGSGDNRAMLVIDWNDGVNPESLAWGYRWNGSATGADMMGAVDAADCRLSVFSSDSGWGLYVNGIDYGTLHSQAGDDSHYWSYWTDNSGAGEDWSSSWTGMSDRVLENNCWDGWSYTGWDQNYNPISAPGPASAAAVPEPCSAAGLLTGLIGVGGYWWRRRPQERQGA